MHIYDITELRIPPGYDELLQNQRGQLNRESNDENILLECWEDFEMMRPHFPKNMRTVIDIGCGLGFVSLMLHEQCQIQDLQCFLFDKNLVTSNIEKKEFRTTHQHFYNSFECAKTAVSGSSIPTDLIHFVDAEPENLKQLPKMDLAFSLFSWGWHYPVQLYSQEIATLLKPESVVIADVRTDEVCGFDAQLTHLNEIFNCEPQILRSYKGYTQSTVSNPKILSFLKDQDPEYGTSKGTTFKGHRFCWKL